MTNPSRRHAAAHRPALRPAPGLRAYEVDPAVQVIEGNDEDDWALWEDSVQQLDSGFLPIDPFDSVGRRDG
ncbi:hypothetical protein [Ramlibacter sp. PS4R-6]|uniref:hypothetical protein n=1 Tax=Ramlibacter sp. PS4R-6 TaxID=3133438 RepID=UPI0030B00545